MQIEPGFFNSSGNGKGRNYIVKIMGLTISFDKKAEIIRQLQSLRNIGPAIAERLYTVGIRKPEQVKKSNPEKLYEKLRINEGGKLDRCVLYQLRGSVLDIPWWKCKNIKGQTH